ncbi:Helix-turn-helix domain-containing protein [Nonomuraea solani]|uniref:Helix-turn-helix domain-containing protein n=1 Tax=Nonomuraea solani TaxID=1144553 RepID=A0A1H5XU76_9ACTN|nr:Helix-turn-helix domain-containing protein [Nonomuraea solani]
MLHTSAHFKALGHPLRHRMVNVLRRRPATMSELTAALGSTKGTIGYHVRVLREAGLIRLTETRQVRGGTEQCFALVRTAFKLDDQAGAEFLFRAALAEMLPARPGGPEHTRLRHLWLTPDEVRTLADRLDAFAHETGGSGAEPYGLLLSLYRADIPALP